MRFRGLILTLPAAIAIGACDDNSGPNLSGVSGSQIISVKIQPEADTILIPDTVRTTDRLQLRAVARDFSGGVLPISRYVWRSSDTTVARVDTLGLVTPLKLGEVQITASASRIGTASVVILPAENRLIVSPSVDTIFVDNPVVAARDTARLKAIAFDTGGRPLPGVRFSWQSSAPSVATTDSSGKVTAISPGRTTLTVRSPNARATSIVEVAPLARNVSLTAPSLQVLDGDTVQLTARAFDYAGRVIPRRFSWRSSNTAVASVDSAGRVAFIAPGGATIVTTTAFRSDSITVTAQPRKLIQLELGNDFSCGVAMLGRAFCWGKGSAGQLGSIGDSTCFADSLPATRSPCAIAPKRTSLPDLSLSVVAAGDSTGCGISDAKQLYCWGDDTFGQVGNGSGGGGAQLRLATVGAESFTSITVGGAHACALNVGGRAYCWGQDSTGQLGDARRVNSTTPIPVVGSNGLVAQALQYVAISAGAKHTCGLTSDGGALCWGDGSVGALGTGSSQSSDVPSQVAGRPFTRISAGRTHTCALSTGGEVFCWGSNSSGQLGISATTNQLNPVSVGVGYAAIAAGDDFTCALSTAAQISCWGKNSHGQLGRGEPFPGGFSATPTPISSSLRFSSLAVGRRHVCAIDVNGDAWCWGSNIFGALGNSLQAAVRSSPEKVARLR